MRRGAAWFCVLALGACGEKPSDPALDAFSKSPAPTLPDQFHGENLTHWLQAARHGDADVRAEAAWALGELGAGSAEAEEALGRLLADARPDVRTGALAALQRLGVVPAAFATRVLEAGAGDEAGPRALGAALEPLIGVEPLGDVLRSAAVDTGAFRAAKRLMAERGEPAAQHVTPLLASSVDPARQLAACEIIGGIGEKAASAVDPLIKLLVAKPPVGPAAATALGKIGKAAKPALEAFLASPEAKENKQAALFARLALSRIK